MGSLDSTTNSEVISGSSRMLVKRLLRACLKKSALSISEDYSSIMIIIKLASILYDQNIMLGRSELCFD